MSDGYEISFTVTAVCPCCGNDLPANSYMTASRGGGSPFDKDNPIERKDRRVFITPCADCFEWKGPADRTGPNEKTPASRASLSEYAQSKQEPELTAGYTGSACVGDRTYGKVTLCYRSVAKAMSAHEYMLATYLDPDVPAAVSQSKQATPPEQENRDA
jgi:hypothetical protein